MTSQHAIPKMPQEKASPASPKVTEDDGVELEDVDNEEKLPLHEDVMQLARLGELGPIRTLLDQGKYDAKYKDEEGITPLHVRLLHQSCVLPADRHFSGLQSIIITPYANI